MTGKKPPESRTVGSREGMHQMSQAHHVQGEKEDGFNISKQIHHELDKKNPDNQRLRVLKGEQDANLRASKYHADCSGRMSRTANSTVHTPLRPGKFG